MHHTIVSLIIIATFMTGCGKQSSSPEVLAKKFEMRKQYYLQHPDEGAELGKWCGKNVTKIQRGEVTEDESINCKAAVAAELSTYHGF